jgi:hypothetical protein
MRPEMDGEDLLRAELMAVEPSPAFADGVRSRIQQRSAGSLMWLNAAAAVAVVAVTAAVATARRPAVEVEQQTETTPVVAAAIPDVMPSARVRAAKLAPVRQSPVAVARAAARAFEVIVSPDQAMLISRYLAARERLARDVEEADTATTLVSVTPIEVPLIKIELLPAPTIPNPNGGSNK